jgi:hypothetical protein
MAWKTYLVMYFGTGIVKPSEVVKKIERLGFKLAFGPVDFSYDWGEKKPTKENVMDLADKLHEAISFSGATFNLDTHD